MGGRLLTGLEACRTRDANFGVWWILGEWDEADVGVEVRLNGPGDSEHRVEDVLLLAPKLIAGGGGRS